MPLQTSHETTFIVVRANECNIISRHKTVESANEIAFGLAKEFNKPYEVWEQKLTRTYIRQTKANPNAKV